MMKKNMYEIFKNIPKNTRVYIYGTGKEGYAASLLIQHQRKDISFLGYINSFNSGEYAGFPVMAVFDLPEKVDAYDLILIASPYTYEIAKTLNSFKIENYIILDCSILSQLYHHFKTATSVGLPSQENYEKYIDNKEKIEKVMNIFTESDRKLYEKLILQRFDKNRFQSININYFKFAGNVINQYLDYLCHKKIERVIDGGAYDGLTSVMFYNHFTNIKEIYGFEPLYHIFKKDPYKTFIERNEKIKIFSEGLWNRNDILKIRDNGDGSSFIDECSGINQIDNFYYKVNTTTIDRFVLKNKIKKIDFIKMDIEGAELMALKGAIETLIDHRPQLAISIYHSFEDLFEIPFFLEDILKRYSYRLGKYEPGIWDSVLYCIPNELT